MDDPDTYFNAQILSKDYAEPWQGKSVDMQKRFAASTTFSTETISITPITTTTATTTPPTTILTEATTQTARPSSKFPFPYWWSDETDNARFNTEVRRYGENGINESHQANHRAAARNMKKAKAAKKLIESEGGVKVNLIKRTDPDLQAMEQVNPKDVPRQATELEFRPYDKNDVTNHDDATTYNINCPHDAELLIFEKTGRHSNITGHRKPPTRPERLEGKGGKKWKQKKKEMERKKQEEQRMREEKNAEEEYRLQEEKKKMEEEKIKLAQEKENLEEEEKRRMEEEKKELQEEKKRLKEEKKGHGSMLSKLFKRSHHRPQHYDRKQRHKDATRRRKAGEYISAWNIAHTESKQGDARKKILADGMKLKKFDKASSDPVYNGEPRAHTLPNMDAASKMNANGHASTEDHHEGALPETDGVDKAVPNAQVKPDRATTLQQKRSSWMVVAKRTIVKKILEAW